MNTLVLRRTALPVLTAFLLLTASAAFADGDRVMARGFSPNSVFHVESLDAVNTFNGNLMLTVPLGSEYKSNGSLAYGFTLHYDSLAWDYYHYEGIGFGDPGIRFFIGGPYFNDPIFLKPIPAKATPGGDQTNYGIEAVPHGNAGMGWTFSLGEIRGAVGALLGLSYVSQDGTTSAFYSTMHGVSSPDSTSSVSYTNDSTYLRMRKVGTNPEQREIDFPDGTRKHFTCAGTCTSMRPEWNLDWIADPFGNALVIERTTRDDGTIEWDLKEGSLGDNAPQVYFTGSQQDRDTLNQHIDRIHKAFFSHQYPWETRLDRLELTTTSGNVAVYQMSYPSVSLIPRDIVLPWAGTGLVVPYYRPGAGDPNDGKIKLSLLQAVMLPDPAGSASGGSSAHPAGKWSFAYYMGEDATAPYAFPDFFPVSRTAGRLKTAHLPTGGGYKYTYGVRSFPTRECGQSIKDSPAVQFTAVTSRQQIDESDGAVGNPWLYAGGGFLERDPANAPPNCGGISRQFVSAVIDPRGLITQSYFELYPRALIGIPSSDMDQSTLCHSGQDGCSDGVTRNLSTRVLQGSYEDFRNDPENALRRMFDRYLFTGEQLVPATVLRSTYAQYDWSASIIGTDSVVASTHANLRLVGSHTIYSDDSDAGSYSYTESANDAASFDGLGHFRRVDHWGNLAHRTKNSADIDHKVAITEFNYRDDGVNTRRVTFTPGSDFPANYPLAYEPWFLETFGARMTWEKNQTFQEIDLYDTARGYLKARRTLTDTSNVLNDISMSDPDPYKTIHDRVSGNVGSTDLLSTFTRNGDLSAFSVTVNHAMYGGEGATFISRFASADSPSYEKIVKSQYGTPVSEAFAGCDVNIPFLTLATAIIDPNTGFPTKITDVSGVSTSYTYDALGRLATVAPPAQDLQQYAYTLRSDPSPNGTPGNTLTITQGPSGTRHEYEYDSMGRTSHEEENLTGSVLKRKDYYYDRLADGTFGPYPGSSLLSMTREPNASGSGYAFTTFQYDLFGRQTLEKQPDNSTVTTSYSGVRQRADSLSGVATSSGSGTSIKGSYLDSFGRTIRVTDGFTSDQPSVRADYSYDADDHLVKVTSNDAQPRNFFYDGRGLLTSEQSPEMPGVDLQHKNYDAAGLPHLLHYSQSGVSDPSAPTIRDLVFSYDPAMRLNSVSMAAALSQVAPLGGNAKPILKQFHFAPQDSTSPAGTAGRLTWALRRNIFPNPVSPGAVADFEIRKDFSYDASGRVVGTSISSGYDAPANDRFALKTSYEYDKCGNAPCPNLLGIVTRTTYPVAYPCTGCAAQGPNRVIEHVFDRGSVSSITASGASTLTVAALTYHVNGMVNKISRARTGGVFSDVIGADSAGMHRVGSLTWGARSNVDGGSYTYDGAGNLTTIHDASGYDTFKYDGAMRITSASVAGQSQSYQYDLYGNLLSIAPSTGASRQFGVDSSTNHLTKSGGSASNDVTYDFAGNMQSMNDNRNIPRPAGCETSLSFFTDPFGSLLNYSGCNIGKAYLYDADDERVATLDYKAQPLTELWTVRDLDKKVLRDYKRVGNTWTWSRDYVHGPTGLLSTVGPNEAWRDDHVDHLGTIRFVTDASGNAVTLGAQKFWPFGEPVFSNTAERLEFTGHERDDDGTAANEADLDYMHARFYGPTLGRFLSVDRHSGRLTFPQSWNRYSYAWNRPLSLADPDGNQPGWRNAEMAVGRYLVGKYGAANVFGQVKVTDGTGQVRVWDWLVRLKDGTYSMSEVKSGGAGPKSIQLSFDERAMRSGQVILNTGGRPQIGPRGTVLKISSFDYFSKVPTNGQGFVSPGGGAPTAAASEPVPDTVVPQSGGPSWLSILGKFGFAFSMGSSLLNGDAPEVAVVKASPMGLLGWVGVDWTHELTPPTNGGTCPTTYTPVEPPYTPVHQ